MPAPTSPVNPLLAQREAFLTLLYPGKSYPRGLTLNLRALYPAGEQPHERLVTDFYGSNVEPLHDTRLLKWAKEGRGIYFGVALRNGCQGDTNGCALIPALWADLDAKAVVEGPLTRESIERGVAILRERLATAFSPEHQPSLIVHTGGGLQAYWLLKEPLTLAKPGTPEREEQIVQVERVLRGLHVKVGCPPERQDVASIMRLVGWPNPKYDWHPVAKMIDQSERRFTLDDLAGYGVDAGPSEPTRDRDEADADLDLVAAFKARGLYRGPQRKAGRHNVTCPWSSEHTSESGASESIIMAPDSAHEWWGFVCGHGHCQGRGVRDVLAVFWPTADDREADPVAMPPISGGSIAVPPILQATIPPAPEPEAILKSPEDLAKQYADLYSK